MSHEETTPTPTREPEPLGVLAQFPDADGLVGAARKTTDAGYAKVDAFSPFPIHGIDDALRVRTTILPWLVFLGGLTGCVVALGMQFYMNGVEFPFIYSGYSFEISAKPLFSLPANIPVTFELIILFSSFTAFLGMLALNKLPTLSNPLFKSERFQSATTDGFFLWIDAADAKFSEEAATEHMRSLGASYVETVMEELQGREVPAYLFAVGAIAASIALVPPLWIASAAGVSTKPRLSIWWDMDYQAKLKTQTATPLFANTRAMRARVEGTVPRGALDESLPYYQGIEPGGQIATSRGVPATFVNLQTQDQASSAGGTGEQQETEGGAQAPEGGDAAAAQAPPEPDWVDEFPLTVTEDLMQRGRARYDIYCAACHGLTGDGDGLVAQRALSLRQGTWAQPLSFHVADVRNQPVGRIFNTISNGIRKMPAYKEQIPVEDRWAIVLYVKALQRSQNASLADVPESERSQLQLP